MSEEHKRPNPDELLQRAQAEEARSKKGRLKVFLGYAAGVGKTYSMLEAAQQTKGDTDLVVGIVETHGRSETGALLKGLEVIPGRETEYRGTVLTDLDLDAVLQRRPRLVLIDELAHDNAPGSRHQKRYQDVEELLQAGIDVYTTLNIQHVESMRDSVAQITGIWIHESVPDSILDNAAEIELVDLPPDELLKRLKEGKVYVPDQIAVAIDRFFRKGNLLALRELSMRTAGKHADEQTLAYMKEHAIQGPWSSSERLLICIGPDSSGSRLVRSARRLAHDLAAEWWVLLVETPSISLLPEEEQDRLERTMELAQRLGATVSRLQADSAPSACIEFAKGHNITKLVVARPSHVRRRLIRSRPLAEQLALQSDNLDVLVMGGGESTERPKLPFLAMVGTGKGYLLGLGMVGAATLIAFLLKSLFTETNLVMIYFLCVGITGVFGGYGPSILVSVISVLAFDFFFVSPSFTLTVADTQYVLTFLVMLFVGLVTSYLVQRVRLQAQAASRRERETAALYSLGRELAISNSLESYVGAIVKKAKETFGREAIVFLPDRNDPKSLRIFAQDGSTTVDANEQAAALWCYENQKSAGPGTDTLPNAAARYTPLITARGAVGVLALATKSSERRPTSDHQSLLEAFADLAAVAVEGVQRTEEAHEAQMLNEVLRDTERLQTALLNSVSHDLRTPLVSIIGVLSSLEEEGMHLDDKAKKNMVQVALGEAERLNRLITNVLDVSRIEAGALKINRQLSDVQELIGAALDQLAERAGRRKFSVNLPENLPPVWVDSSLMVQALVNIVDNSVKYSQDGSEIEVNARQDSGRLLIEIADRGEGIPERDLSRIFEKFYRVQRPDKVSGTGLGLSITKGIVEAHGGRVTAENRIGGGTTIRIELPLAPSINGIEDNIA